MLVAHGFLWRISVARCGHGGHSLLGWDADSYGGVFTQDDGSSSQTVESVGNSSLPHLLSVRVGKVEPNCVSCQAAVQKSLPQPFLIIDNVLHHLWFYRSREFKLGLSNDEILEWKAFFLNLSVVRLYLTPSSSSPMTLTMKMKVYGDNSDFESIRLWL